MATKLNIKDLDLVGIHYNWGMTALDIIEYTVQTLDARLVRTFGEGLLIFERRAEINRALGMVIASDAKK